MLFFFPSNMKKKRGSEIFCVCFFSLLVRFQLDHTKIHSNPKPSAEALCWCLFILLSHSISYFSRLTRHASRSKHDLISERPSRSFVRCSGLQVDDSPVASFGRYFFLLRRRSKVVGEADTKRSFVRWGLREPKRA